MKLKQLIRHPSALRSRLYCELCGADLLDSIAVFRHVTIDHFRPKVADGSDEADNLLVVCHACNWSKADKLYSHIEYARADQGHFVRCVREWFARFRGGFRGA